MHIGSPKVYNSQRIQAPAPTVIVLVVPYIVNECSFGIKTQRSLQTSSLTSPLSLNLFIISLLMDSPSSLHHLGRSSLTIRRAAGSLGLFSNDQTTFNATENQTVAVEFDTYKNGWDPSHYHIGIDVNSIVSKATLQQDDYLVTKSSDQIFFCRPISILGDKIFYLSPNINLRRRNLYFIATFQNIDYIGRQKLFSSPKVCLF